MRFALLDRISELEPGQRIVATKSPTLSEEYLQDHFPMFPVMPGVLMLEAMYQASAWLLRATDNFTHSMVLLKEAKNIKYSGFVKPGETLEIESELQQREGNQSWFKTVGRRDGQIVVRAKMLIESFNLDRGTLGNESVNQRVVSVLKQEFEVLYPSLGMKEVVG
jgi:3-hydroxyacyl-[acyl-carrier-protein] dehydratase